MTIAILTIGDEICIGQIVNTNAAWIAEQCSLNGWRVLAHSVVGDDAAVMLSEFDRLLHVADVLLITGGLGATHDDRTKHTLVQYLDDRLECHEPTLEHLRDLMRQRGREFSERIASQALLPTRCEPLRNMVGTASGMWFVVQQTGTERIVVSMPGVPHEMKHLMETHVIPRLQARSVDESVVVFKTLLTAGIAETTLADMIGTDAAIEELLEGQELAFLPSPQGVKLRLSVTAANRSAAEAALERLESKLRSSIGRYIYGENKDSMQNAVGQMLKEHGKTVAVAESCTGGLLGAAFTDVAGSSAYFMGGVQCYSNEAKIQFVNVKQETITRHGSVSYETAEALATNIRVLFGTDYGISITGIAGPDGGTPEKSVGTVWVGLADVAGCTVERFVFSTDRAVNRERAVAAALLMVQKKLLLI